MTTLLGIRSILEDAAVFARAADPQSAVARAKDALRLARDEDARAEAILMLERFEAEERAWFAANEARGREVEVEEAPLLAEPVKKRPIAPLRAWRRAWRHLALARLAQRMT